MAMLEHSVRLPSRVSQYIGEMILFAILILITIQAPILFVVLVLLLSTFFLAFRRILNFNTFLFTLVLSLILEKYSYYIGFTVRLPMLLVASFLVALLLQFLLRGEFKIRYTPFYGLFVALFFCYSLGAIWALNPIRVIRVCVLYLFLFFLFFLTYQILTNKERLINSTRYFVLVGILGSIYGIYQVVGFIFDLPTQLPFVENLRHHEYYNIGLTVFKVGSTWFARINSTFNDPVFIGCYAAMSLMMLLSLMSLRYIKQEMTFQTKLVFAAGIFSLLTCIILTFSRSTWVGLCMGIAVLGYYFFKNSLTRKKILVVSFLFGSIFLLTIALFEPFRDATFGRVMQTFDPSDVSTSGHKKWLQIAIQAWSENPLFGVGLNNFEEYYASAYQTSGKAMTHSAYVSFLAETGLVGFTLEIILISLIFKHLFLAISIARKNQDTDSYFLIIGLLAGYVVMLGTNITYHLYTQFYVWFFNALAVAASTLVIKNPNRNYSVAS